MKKKKKKRESKHSFSGDAAVEPLEIVIVDGEELLMMFSFSNRGLKMLKCGEVFKRTFLKDGKQCHMQFMHRDIYQESYKKLVDLKLKHQAEKKRQAEKDAEEPKEPEKDDDSEENG
jgi:hypothetical protein